MAIEALRAAVDAIRAAGEITEEDVRRLRRDLLPRESPRASRPSACLSWRRRDCRMAAPGRCSSSETLADFLIFGERPTGACLRGRASGCSAALHRGTPAHARGAGAVHRTRAGCLRGPTHGSSRSASGTPAWIEAPPSSRRHARLARPLRHWYLIAPVRRAMPARWTRRLQDGWKADRSSPAGRARRCSTRS
jgi:hypothetical protein